MQDSRRIDLKRAAVGAMAKYGFEPDFPKDALREAAAMDEAAAIKGNMAAVRDLRHLLWSSIDNPDSLDLDQIEYCEEGGAGEIHVKVAIADVDAFVGKGSATDMHAARNGSSVYTGVRIFPMLPERLSTDLTSLRVEEDRLAVVIEYSVRQDGRILPGGLSRALVRNKAKLDYESVGGWLEGALAAPEALERTPGLEEQVRLQDGAAGRLRGYRLLNGMLELDTIEARPVIAGGTVNSLVVERKNRARFIIEQLMVAANETMSSYLTGERVPFLQRVVRTPRDWGAIRDVASSYGTGLPAEPDSKALSQFLARRRDADPLRFPDLSLTVVKLLGPGEYVVIEPGKKAIGHFCLAIMDYTHATAPNRRYADVIIQRLLKSVLAGGECPYTVEELESHATRLTELEKGSKKVERFMRKVAAAAMLSVRMGETFDAIVTGASEKGTYVRLLAPPAEGRVVRGERGMRVGDKVRARLIHIDPSRGYIDFERGGNRR